jgi:lysozyme
MTPENRQKLKNLLVSHEQFKQFAYIDVTGHITVGIGRNLSTRGISTVEALSLLDDDIIYFSSKLLSLLPIFNTLDDIRKIVLIDICFNVGLHGLLGFEEMLRALEDKDYDRAADEIIKSKACEQCPERYHQLAEIMRIGEI